MGAELGVLWLLGYVASPVLGSTAGGWGGLEGRGILVWKAEMVGEHAISVAGDD